MHDPDMTRALERADSGLMRCLERAEERPAKRESWFVLLRQVQCGSLAKFCSQADWIARKSDRDAVRRIVIHVLHCGKQEWREVPLSGTPS